MKWTDIHAKLAACRKCPNMCGTPVHGAAVPARVLLIGQAPGPHEARLGRPFAFTAGKTLFKWLHQATTLDEAQLRQKIYFAAVARCFPGKAVKGAGDREPSPLEIANCREHLIAEVQILQPQLILAVGKLAITEVLGCPKTTPLGEVVGRVFEKSYHGQPVQVIPLPHPSGVSRWPQSEPGKTLLAQALRQIRHYWISHESCKTPLHNRLATPLASP